MALSISRQSIEVEQLIGAGDIQTYLSAESLVPGAGREAVEPLLFDAHYIPGDTTVQDGRVVVTGSVSCQAVYRQGDEVTLRALTAEAPFEETIDVPGAERGMTARLFSRVNEVATRYENGHMIFRTGLEIKVTVFRLAPVDVIDSVAGDHAETEFRDIESVKLAAEAESRALLSARVTLPASLDARTTLMDWSSAVIESSSPDLGGVRVRGTVYAEVLIGTGIPGRPAAVIKYPLPFDQLVEIPDWLAGNAAPSVSVRSLKTGVEQGEAGQDSALTVEAEVLVAIQALVTDRARALTDAYSTSGPRLVLEKETLSVCTRIQETHSSEQIKGTVLLSENAPGVGTVLAVRALAEPAGMTASDGISELSGVLTISVLYTPGGGDKPLATRAELPFTADISALDGECFWTDLTVTSVEANALMSDRLEIRAILDVKCHSRATADFRPVTNVTEGAPLTRRPGIVLFWPGKDDSVWSIGRRYNLPVDQVIEMNGSGAVEPGKAVVLRI